MKFRKHFDKLHKAAITPMIIFTPEEKWPCIILSQFLYTYIVLYFLIHISNYIKTGIALEAKKAMTIYNHTWSYTIVYTLIKKSDWKRFAMFNAHKGDSKVFKVFNGIKNT